MVTVTTAFAVTAVIAVTTASAVIAVTTASAVIAVTTASAVAAVAASASASVAHVSSVSAPVTILRLRDREPLPGSRPLSSWTRSGYGAS